MCACIYVGVHVCLYLYVCMCICEYMCTCVSVCVYVYVYMFVCECECIIKKPILKEHSLGLNDISVRNSRLGLSAAAMEAVLPAPGC